MTNPFFTIVIPLHNRAAFIPELVNTILKQEFTNFELILVNDGSTDQTQSILNELRDSRITCISTPNQERGAARNQGARLAKGKYINFFDSDDEMRSNHLKDAHEFCKKENYPLWFHTCYGFKNEHGEIIGYEYGVEKNPESKLIKTNYLGCNSVFVERDFFLENLFCDTRTLASSEDWELWLRLMARQPLKRCKSLTFYILQHKNRSIHTISAKNIIQRDTLLLNLLLADAYFLKKFKNQLSIFEADRYTFFALHLIESRDKKNAFAYLLKSFSTSKQVVFRKRFIACCKNLFLLYLGFSIGLQKAKSSVK
ncbi:MAG: glycosyltransferase family 2 protein [Chryseotalea sp.]